MYRDEKGRGTRGVGATRRDERHMRFRETTCAVLLAVLCCGRATAALSSADLVALQVRGEQEGWTFTVGENEATQYSPDELHGLVVPKDWRAKAPVVWFKQQPDLPAQFDWRPLCTPVKSQGGCGSCWAFATVGTLESAIRIVDGETVDLSEQWLVSCNQETEPPHLLGDGEWGCNGGWFAHQYHESAPDRCAGFGAVLEADFPYAHSDVPCDCPYNHRYWIDSWAYVGGEEEIPPVDGIKQAIMTYGPVSAAVYADSAMYAYTGGVFNASTLKEVNHAIMLVGWDDTLGTDGAWILRNSWGTGWGIDGYMYIEYGCSNVGFGACFIDYPGAGLGQGPTITKQPESKAATLGSSSSFTVEASGVSALHYQWTKDGAPVGDDANTYTIDAVTPADAGVYVCHVSDLRGITASQPATLRLLIIEGTPTTGTSAIVTLAAACAFLGALMGARPRRKKKARG